MTITESVVERMPLSMGRQANGSHSLARMAIRIVGSDGEDIAYYRFRVNPENYSLAQPQRTTVMKTRSATVVEDYGADLKQIQFSGTTGYQRDPQGKSGYDRLADLYNLIEEYSLIGHRVDDTNNESAEMYFYNFTDGGSYVVHLAPEGFAYSRNVERPLLYDYQLSLVVLRRAGDANIRDIQDEEIGNTFYRIYK